MINVPLLQGLKEYYDYVNLCNTLGFKPDSFEENWREDYITIQFLSSRGVTNNQLKGK